MATVWSEGFELLNFPVKFTYKWSTGGCMEKSPSITKLAAALVKAQSKLKPVSKESKNPFYKSKYADLASIVEASQKVLAENGLAVSQFVTTLSEGSGLVTLLLHESGEYIQDTMPLLLSKPDAQGQGSAITYARRYAFMAALGLTAVDEDDDGNAASFEPRPAGMKTGTQLATDQKVELISEAQLGYLKNLIKHIDPTEFVSQYNTEIEDLPKLTKYEAMNIIRQIKGE